MWEHPSLAVGAGHSSLRTPTPPHLPHTQHATAFDPSNPRYDFLRLAQSLSRWANLGTRPPPPTGLLLPLMRVNASCIHASASFVKPSTEVASADATLSFLLLAAVRALFVVEPCCRPLFDFVRCEVWPPRLEGGPDIGGAGGSCFSGGGMLQHEGGTAERPKPQCWSLTHDDGNMNEM